MHIYFFNPDKVRAFMGITENYYLGEIENNNIEG